MRSRFDRYRRALRALRHECPTDIPVRVRLNHRDNGEFGSTTVTERGRERQLTITLRTRIDGRPVTAYELEDTIVHEWAHAMTSAPQKCDGFHGPLWGVAYAQAYQAVVED